MKKNQKTYLAVSIIIMFLICCIITAIATNLYAKDPETDVTTSTVVIPTEIITSPSTLPSPTEQTYDLITYNYDMLHIIEPFSLKYQSYWNKDIDTLSGGRADIILSRNEKAIEIDFSIARIVNFEVSIDSTLNHFGTNNYSYSYEQTDSRSLKLDGQYEGLYKVFNIDSPEIGNSNLIVVQVSSTEHGYGFITIWDTTGNNTDEAYEILESIEYL